MLKFIGLWGIELEKLCPFSQVLAWISATVFIGFFAIGIIALIWCGLDGDFNIFTKNKKKTFHCMTLAAVVLFIGIGGWAVVFYIVGLCAIKIIGYIVEQEKLKQKYIQFNDTTDVKSYTYIKITSMDFDTFEKLYTISPRRFCRSDCYVFEERLYYKLDEFSDSYKVRITFKTFNDYRKYYSWLQKKQKDKDLEKQAKLHKAEVETMKLILEQAQKDIDKLRKQSEDEIKQATDTMKDVSERLKKD